MAPLDFGTRVRRRLAAVAMLAALLAALLAAWPAQAAKTRNAAILARALSYELTLEERVGPTVTVAVIYKRGAPRSEANADEWMEAFRSLSATRIKDRPLTAVRIAYSTSDVVSAIDNGGADVLLVADGLEAEAPAIARLARAKHVLTASNAIANLAKDLTLCVTEEGDKVKIVVNLDSAHQEGIRFSSNLLKLATIIR
jgi:hypothetical protein